MSPIRTYSNWNVRSTNKDHQIEPYRRYYFICEGCNTEKWYFQKLIDIRKTLMIHSEIHLDYIEKTGSDTHLSDPMKLILFADQQKHNGSIPFDINFDKMIVVFDTDIFEESHSDFHSNFEEVLQKGLQKNILGITNPSFELFLLLHYPDSVEEIIIPNADKIIKNEWIGTGRGRKRCIEDIFRKKSNMRPKKNSNIGELANNVAIAIEQEKKLNTDILNCKGNITCNIGSIIKSIIDDQNN